MLCRQLHGLRFRQAQRGTKAIENQKKEIGMIGVISKIVLICILILFVVTLAGTVALFLYTVIDIISEIIKWW